MQTTTNQKDRVRATRFVPPRTLFVSSKTIGTEIAYNLTAENMSRTGLLLTWSQARPIPFIENTIIEMVIDPRREFLSKPVTCLGKIVRRKGEYPHGPEAGLEFGVNIVQIDHTDFDQWESCLADLASSGAKTVASLPPDKAALELLPKPPKLLKVVA